MKNNKKAKKAILQELESIKSLLSEDELDSIPVLEHPFGLPQSEPEPELELQFPIDETDIPTLTSFDSTEDTEATLLSSGEDLTIDQELDVQPLLDSDAGLDIDSQLDNSMTQSNAIEDIVVDDSPELKDSILLDTSAVEPILAPDALPGQQSLFLAAAEVEVEVEAEVEVEVEAEVEVEVEEIENTSTEKNNKSVVLNSENPFLPKHIRDRLHTQKSLVDIIKDDIALEPIANLTQTSKQALATSTISTTSASDTSESLNALDHAIEVTIAEYLPKIEARLRQRIKQYLEEDAETARKLSTKAEPKAN